jgi:copper chaperone CopZ
MISGWWRGDKPMSDSTYTVVGMTCAHCVAAVTAQVSELPGTKAVDVDLASGALVVSGDVAPAEVRAAVEEAGYSLA